MESQTADNFDEDDDLGFLDSAPPPFKFSNVNNSTDGISSTRPTRPQSPASRGYGETAAFSENDVIKKLHVQQNYLEFKMVDGKSIMEQVWEFQKIADAITTAGMVLDPNFHVCMIICKLPPSWEDYKMKLMHKKDMSLDLMLHHLRVEEMLRNQDKKEEPPIKAHGVGLKSNKRSSQKKRGFNKHEPGHMAQFCYHWKYAKGKMKEKEKRGSQGERLETDMVGGEADWWIATAATRHICKNKNMFSSYELVGEEMDVFMGSSSSSKVVGKGTVELRFTSGKTVLLQNVLHVPDISKNLVSGSLLSKHGFTMVFESNKFVLTKNDMFVGKGFANSGMFKLNIIN